MVGGTFLCSTCSASFESNASRREHMREPWHVFNMQRKVAELPAISLESYQSLVGAPDLEQRLTPSAKPADDEMGNDSPEESISQDLGVGHGRAPWDDDDSDDELLSQPERCLFCSSISNTVDECLDHMKQSHGFHISRLNELQTDLDTVLAYLNLVISRFHSCLYCGHEKYSADAVRSHMISKGHCMLDLSEGSDFLDFWVDSIADDEDHASTEGFQKLSESELRLQSGSVASSRHDGRPSNKPARSRRQPVDTTALTKTSNSRPSDTPDSPTPTPSSSRHPQTTALSKRDAMGLIGLSDSQQRSLALTQQKIVAREQRSMNDARWTVEKFGNKTKMRHFKVSRSGIHSAMQVC